MKRITLDKISSSTKNTKLKREVRLSPEIISEAGYVLAGRVHGIKTAYNDIENCDGRMIRVHAGDIVAGTLGHRDALKGYSGRVPEKIAVGDRLQILNLGGVVGECTSGNPQVGKPFDFEVLGSILVFPEFESRKGEHAHVARHGALKEVSESAIRQSLSKQVPVIFIAGTCMHAGKTSVAVQVIRGLKNAGKRVGACKLTGVSLLRDTLEMKDYGADWARSFIDAGVVTTDGKSAVRTAYQMIGSLVDDGADVIVAELGDGILGSYGVKEILAEKELMATSKAFILCANDPVGAWGGVEILKSTYGFSPDIVSGPTTDNLAGITYIERELAVRAINARKDADGMVSFVQELIQKGDES